MSWRPKNWRKIVKKNFDIFFEERNWNHTFEAGADAILEALKKSGIAVDMEEWGFIEDEKLIRKGE